MAQKEKEGAALEMDAARLASSLRCLELTCRLLLIASAVEGFQLQAADVQCICKIFIENVHDIKTIMEV